MDGRTAVCTGAVGGTAGDGGAGGGVVGAAAAAAGGGLAAAGADPPAGCTEEQIINKRTIPLREESVKDKRMCFHLVRSRLLGTQLYLLH